MKILNQFNFVDHYTYEVGDDRKFIVGESYVGQVSKTVPGMTLSLKDLLARYVRGDSVTVFEPVFTGDADTANFEAMDEMDRIDAARQLKDSIADKQAEMQFKRNERAAAAAEKLLMRDIPETPDPESLVM